MQNHNLHQFVGLAVDGTAIHGTREELLYNPRLAGYIAWVFPEEVSA